MVEAFDLLRICALFLVLVIAAYTDLTDGKVYNWLTYPGILIGLLVCLAVGDQSMSCPTVQQSLIGLLLGFGIFYLGYLVGGLGMGDVKLMAAVGALTGWHFALSAAFYSALVGALLAVGLLLLRGRLGEGLSKCSVVLFSPGRMREKEHVDGTPVLTGLTIPYGFATAVGALCAFFMGMS